MTHPLQESSFFTQLGDVCSVVVSKHLISKNGISNLGRSNTFKLQVSLYEDKNTLQQVYESSEGT